MQLVISYELDTRMSSIDISNVFQLNDGEHDYTIRKESGKNRITIGTYIKVILLASLLFLSFGIREIVLGVEH